MFSFEIPLKLQNTHAIINVQKRIRNMKPINTKYIGVKVIMITIKEREIIRELAKQVALLSQSNQPPEIPVRDLVAYGRYPHQRYGHGLTRQDEEIVERAMVQVKIAESRDHLVSRLSGGQQQRAYIAMALAQDTPVVFLDEPTTCLDVHICFEIMELVRSLHEAGKTVIMVLHDLSLALEYADHVILMDQGRIAAQGSPQEIISAGVLDEVFHIRTRQFSADGKPIYHFERRDAAL